VCIGSWLVGILCFLPSPVRVGGVAARQAALRAAGLRGAALIELAAALDQPAAEAVMYAGLCGAETIFTALVLNLRDTASGGGSRQPGPVPASECRSRELSYGRGIARIRVLGSHSKAKAGPFNRDRND
jgi:hypothetical protein